MYGENILFFTIEDIFKKMGTIGLIIFISLEIERHLAFRDYLRSHTVAAKEYGELKKGLSQQFPYDIESHITGKEELVLKIQEQALEWSRQKKK